MDLATELMSDECPGLTQRADRTTGLNITVLSGGPGAERQVSLDSGRAIAAALRRCGHRVRQDDIGPKDLSALDRKDIDLVFIALHGTFGEDGQLQAILERRGLPYCGSGPQASRLAMDKARSKQRCREIGVGTADYEVVKWSQSGPEAELRTLCRQAAARWALPAVVKPVAEGSSVECHIVRDLPAMADRLGRVLRGYGNCMIEAYVAGPELTVGILGSQALPVLEIRTKREFYDYQAKYLDDDTEYRFDPDLPEAVIRRTQQESLAVFKALGCRDFGRVDWIVDRQAGPMFLEVNTIPGFTDHSLLPKAAGRAGIDFDRLCQRIVALAWARVRG